MKQLLKRYQADLEVRGFRPLTVTSYVGCVRRFGEFAGHRRRFTVPMVLRFLDVLTFERAVSSTTRVVYCAAFRRLFEITLGKPRLASKIPKVRSKRAVLPTVLRGEEAQQILEALESPMHRCIASLCFGAGLRVGEAVALRVEHIDSKRGVLRIMGKGDKSREVPLDPVLLQQLRRYWRSERPRGPWLFPARGDSKWPHLNKRTFNKALHVATQRAGLGHKRVTPHVLRHSYATYLLMHGADVRSVQVLLGHRHLQTTIRYLHVCPEHLAKLPKPLSEVSSARR